jgi:hypothetical protein
MKWSVVVNALVLGKQRGKKNSVTRDAELPAPAPTTTTTTY